MTTLNSIRKLLQEKARPPKEGDFTFFKTGPGHYAEHDKFMGVSVPNLRVIAKTGALLTLKEIQVLLESPINEERLLALFILANQYQKGESAIKNEVYQFYMANLKHVNNWNLVDGSAPYILGAHLMDRNKDILLTLAQSEILWERRIAIVATQHFIRQNSLDWTFKIARILLNDSHDLIHKAVGWMLREAGKRDEKQLRHFLDQHAQKMPRTMLRYSIERFPEELRQAYLRGKS